MKRITSGDRIFFILVVVLSVLGLAIFTSASVGLLARADASPEKLIFTQIMFGLIPGAFALLLLRLAPQKLLLHVSPFVYLATILTTVLVFIPPFRHVTNGAVRWIDLGFTTVQPAEFLKIGTIAMLAWYLSKIKGDIQTLHKGLIPFLVITGIPALILFLQPNTSTLIVLSVTVCTMYFLAGAPWRDLLILTVLACLAFAALYLTHSYVRERVHTFMQPSQNSQTTGYQIQQSLIAIGSGGLVGRGFGQGVQKFNYLPEPVGDSIFAVYSEEFGFIGALILILLFFALSIRGFMIASDATSLFGSLLVTGLILSITLSAFLNMGAMLSIFPLTGLPLPFISHGGTALLATLASAGLILNVAAHRKPK